MQINPTIFLSLFLACGFAADHELLHLEFNDTSSIGKQVSTSLSTASVNGDVGPSKDFPGAADFKNSGFLRVSKFAHPQGAFSVESRFRLKTFSPDGNPFISDLVNTATWDGNIQGFGFRVGGGFLYPVLPKAAYADTGLYQRSIKELGNNERASLSRCVGELFSAAKPGGTAQWLEVFTDQCVELEAWTYMVGVWDGKSMKLYLNGKEATDPWRINGAGSMPKLDSVTQLNIGGRGNGGSDYRPFNGIMDFVRIVDTAMSEKQISSRYLETFTPETRQNLCLGIILPITPASGELAGGDRAFRMSIFIHPACSDSLDKFDLDDGDSLEVEMAEDPNFKEVFLHFTIRDTSFRPDEIKKSLKTQPKSECFFRARVVKKGSKGSAKASALGLEAMAWSDSRPFFWDPNSAPLRVSRLERKPLFRTVVLQPEAGLFIPGSVQPTIYVMSGRRLNIRFNREMDGWRLESDAALPAGLLLLRIGE